ncbi:retron-type reverse transcriptase [Pusillimonas noertemannii]|uniref:Retron-type reverse transcriptase n=1 Tax=Pusillimonas noertemannii TaxID=305977 RepID=A0A2U1CMD9_9BURK|nr:alpha/beta hydrolase [Pusillimonas noertemannii]PVY62157.1 retron-type reverse transcriptase [Pusillimonas noertemannii]TFL11099.1 alpha/beta hydrolase [Pusillimonas noertemannii]
MAKTYNNLYSSVIDFDNLWKAYLSARMGKRYHREVSQFSANLEERLINIHNHLIWKSWQPGIAREFRVMEPKQRNIQAPPFKDRIVHHALFSVVEPLFEKRFINHSYACRHDKGAQRAVFALQKMLREAQRRYEHPYVIKADISKYFASIDHAILFRAIEKVISCRDTLNLWRTITAAYGHDDGVGLPVGALTSQLSANIMLDQLDHTVTDYAGIGMYVRYMDDFIIVAPNKRAAEMILIFVADEVEALNLRLNPKTSYFPASRGVDFAGYRTWSTHMLPRKRNIKKARIAFRKLAKQYRAGIVGLDYIQPRVASFLAYAKHCQAADTVAGVLSDFTLTRSYAP